MGWRSRFLAAPCRLWPCSDPALGRDVAFGDDPAYMCWGGPLTAAGAGMIMTIDEIIENFALLDQWDDRYRYVIELGRTLAPLPDAARTEANKVQGCASQVWVATTVEPNGAAGPILRFVGDSDAFIVRGLIAILLTLYSGKSASEILSTDAIALFDRLGLREHLTPQRSNGFRSMMERLKSDARAASAASPESKQRRSA